MAQLEPLTVARVLVPVVCACVTAWVGVAAVQRAKTAQEYSFLAHPFGVLAGAFSVAGVTYAVLRWTTELGASAVSLVFFIIMIPWIGFALRYIGRWGLLAGRVKPVGYGFAGLLISASFILALSPDAVLPTASVQLLDTFIAIGALAVLAVIFGLSGLVLLSTYRDQRLSVVSGVIVVLPVGELLFAVQVTNPDIPVIGDLLVAGAFILIAVTLLASVSRYDILERPAGIWERGERFVLTETDEAVFVLDAEKQVVRANNAARHAFGESSDFPAVFDRDVTELQTTTEPISCWTRQGQRSFDVRVSPLTDPRDERVGYTVRLIDVTERELRRQRLQVLNRILRHNVRNKLDVIRAHAETADNQPILDATDQLTQLSTQARQIEQLVEQTARNTQPTSLLPFLEDVVDSTVDDSSATVAVEGPDVTVSIDRSLCRYAVHNLVENAVQHNPSQTPRVVVRVADTADGTEIVVSDDGPGIPETERSVITAGGEEPLAHASSLGLWSTQWAVQTMGGSLSFDESEFGGAAVCITVQSGGAQ